MIRRLNFYGSVGQGTANEAVMQDRVVASRGTIVAVSFIPRLLGAITTDSSATFLLSFGTGLDHIQSASSAGDQIIAMWRFDTIFRNSTTFQSGFRVPIKTGENLRYSAAIYDPAAGFSVGCHAIVYIE